MEILFRVTTVPLSLRKLITGQLPYMQSQGFKTLMISADGEGSDLVEKEQLSPLITINLTRKITPLQDFKALWQFYKLCKQYKPTIVHSHTPKAGIISMLGGKLAGVPIRLHTVAGLPLMEANGLKRIILNMVEKLTYSCATKVYPNSTILKQFILDNKFCDPEKVKVIGNGSSNGIDTAYFHKDEVENEKILKLKLELGIEANEFVFIFIGRLVKDKGIQELVNAFTGLCAKYAHIKLLLVGPLEPELDPLDEVTLLEIKQNPAIISVGFQNDVRPYLAISHVLAFPSYREGFPNVPMQAGCFELPSIVTNINGCNEIITDSVNGLIIPAKSTDALKNAMEKFLIDVDFYKSLQLNARKMILDRYEQKYFWGLLLKEYQKALDLIRNKVTAP
jgi:glycosyltransferase involved in cell wall biosynthesis